MRKVAREIKHRKRLPAKRQTDHQHNARRWAVAREDRAAHFVRRIIDAAHQCYPEQMARVLTADDEEISLATAQAVIDRLRSKFDLPRASAVLVYVDEPGNALHYRVSGPSRDGTQEQEILVVGYGDGLVGLRGY